MSSNNCLIFPRGLPKAQILVDPCFVLDELGLWATARLSAANERELDLFLPARRTMRRVEIGHGEDAVRQLGQGSRQRLLGALDRALARPLRLVVDPRRSDGGETILDGLGKPRESAVAALASIVGASSYTVADYALELSIREPRADRLALGAASVFGPHVATLFRASTRVAPPPLGRPMGTVPKARPRGRAPSGVPMRVARYVRTATLRAKGRNAMEAQNRRIDDYLHEIGVQSAHNVVDEGCSGMGVGRSGIETILRLAERGEIDAVVATSADRFFRSATQFDRFLAQLRSRGVSVMLVDHASTLGAWGNVPTRRRRVGL